ncbi:hypothetical protein XA68_14517 [Ophiocordyceps unilateralis]|uniref:CENP-V/GFA domain-containing protein n=1 Tax=Ophiocordyceps unilateralis TaxID=268505 RepID=A0A2A9PLK5_OPHUN|nr:hypothetical protein XA68_14517 [Ophiocordyceps unilateralis]
MEKITLPPFPLANVSRHWLAAKKTATDAGACGMPIRTGISSASRDGFRCACGEVRLEVVGKPVETALCHCTDCQKWTGGAFTANLIVKNELFKVTQGSVFFFSPFFPPFFPPLESGGTEQTSDDGREGREREMSGTVKEWDAVGASGHANRRFFCGRCGSGLYTELDLYPGHTCVKAGVLDGRAPGLGGEVGVEFYGKNRVDYLRPCPGARQVAAFGLDEPALGSRSGPFAPAMFVMHSKA